MTGGAAERAFILQFSIDEGGRGGNFSGRVEHVASGESIRFGSPEELTAFLSRKVGSTPLVNGGTKGAAS